MFRSILAAASLAIGLAVAGSASAQTFTSTSSNTTFTGGAGFNSQSNLRFDPNVSGETATITFGMTAGTNYIIAITGQNNNSSSFFNFFVDPDGSGAAPFTQLGGNINLGTGSNNPAVSLPSFVSAGTTGFLRIVNGGTSNNSGGVINALISLTAVAVPGPIAGAGLPLLLGLAGGWLVLRRRRQGPLGA